MRLNKVERNLFTILSVTVFLISLIFIEYINAYSYINFILFYLILVSPIFLLILDKRSYFLSPGVLILIAFAVYELLKIPFYFNIEIAKETALLSTNFIVTDFGKASFKYLSYTFIVVLSIIFFQFMSGQLLPFKVNEGLASQKFLKYLRTISFLFVSICFVFIFFKSGSNFLFLLSARSGNEDALLVKSGSYIFILLLMLCLVLSPLLIINKVKWSLPIYVSSCILLFLYTGSRGFIFYSIISCLFAYSYKIGRFPYRLGFMIFTVLLISFSILGIFRSTSGLDVIDHDVIESKKETSSIFNYQLQLRDESIFSNIEEIDEFYLSSVFTPITMLLPRSILGELKPRMIDGEIATVLWGRDDLGMPVNLSTELYLNFGFFGFIFLLPLLLVLNIIFNYTKKKGLIPIYISIMIMSQTFLSSKLVYAFQIIILILIISLLYNLMKRRRNVNF